VPVTAAFAAFSLLSGTLFYVLGNRAQAKLKKELQEEVGVKVG
jgi:hypothetical protein